MADGKLPLGWSRSPEGFASWLARIASIASGSAMMPLGQGEESTMVATEAGERSTPTRVFISYSRKDGDFAERLRDALRLRGFEAYLDKHDILPGEPWQERLSGLIKTADTVIFCLSPNFVASPVCDWEVNEAERIGKRLLPVVAADTPGEGVPQRLKRLNYIFIRGAAELADGLEKLIVALQTDIAWIREHTRLGERTGDWFASGRSEATLLRGDRIAEAEAWLSRRPQGAPEITADIGSFIAESRRAETERARRATRRARIVTAVSLCAAAIMAFLGWQMFGQWQAAQIRQSLNLANYADQQVARGSAVVGMLLGLEAMRDARALPLLERLRPMVPEAGVSLYRAFHAGSGKWSLMGHGKKITAARIDRKLEFVATASEDGTARVWNLRTGKQHSALVGHDGPITTLEFSPDGELLATGSTDRTARIWDWRAASTLSTLVAHRSEVRTLAFDGTGTRLLSTAEDGSAHVWAVRTGERLITVSTRDPLGNTRKLVQAAFTPEGAVLTVNEGLPRSARLWDVAARRIERELHKAGGDGKGEVLFSPDGARITVTGENGTQLLDAANGAEIAALQLPEGALWSRSRFSPNSAMIAIDVRLGNFPERRSRLDIVDAGSGRRICSIEMEKATFIRFEFDNSATKLLTYVGANHLPPLVVWETTTCSKIADFKSRSPDTEYRPAENNYIVSPDGSRVVSWSNGTVAVWTTTTGQELEIVKAAGRDDWRKAALNPVKDEAAVLNSGSNKVAIIDTLTGALLYQLDGDADRDAAPIYNRDGTRLVTHDGHTLTIWDARSWTPVAAPVGDTRKIYSVTLSHDGTHALVTYEAEPGDGDGAEPQLGAAIAKRGRAIAVNDGGELVLRNGDEQRHWDQLTSPDGRRDVVQESGANPKLVDRQSGETIATLPHRFFSVDVSADRKRFVTALDETAWVWDFTTGKLISELVAKSEDVFMTLGINRDGTRSRHGTTVSRCERHSDRDRPGRPRPSPERRSVKSAVAVECRHGSTHQSSGRPYRRHRAERHEPRWTTAGNALGGPHCPHLEPRERRARGCARFRRRQERQRCSRAAVARAAGRHDRVPDRRRDFRREGAKRIDAG